MFACAKEGTTLRALVRLAVPLCQRAQQQCPRTGPGKPPDYDDWQMAILIMIAVLHKRKTKSSQYRFLFQRRSELMRWLNLQHWPARSTYFDRYQRAHTLFEIAIELQGQQAISEGVADATAVAVDKSLIAARGPLWHKSDRKKSRIPKGLHGLDRDSDFGYSAYNGWVQGYSYEVIVTASVRSGTVLPLLASAATASASEHTSFSDKIEHLHDDTRHMLADSGYDNMNFGDRIEYDAAGNNHRTGRRLLCPANPRHSGARTADEVAASLPTDATVSQRRRVKRLQFLESKTGQRLYARRGQTVEPFHDHFKHLFDLTDHVWHRGLANNQTQLLAAIFCHQLLLRYNHRRGHCNGQIQWILDAL